MIPATAMAALFALAAAFPIQAQRAFNAFQFALQLENSDVGPIQSVAGGAAFADVIVEPTGPSNIFRKHLGAPKYADFAIEVGLNMGKGLQAWIEASFKQQEVRKSGELEAGDFHRKVRSVRAFTNALLTEVTFPAADGDSKEPAYLGVKFSPETVRHGQGDGSVMPPQRSGNSRSLPGNFSLQIDGLDCSQVSRIESLTVKFPKPENTVGENRDLAQAPGKIEFPNLVIYLPESAAQGFLDWHQDFVINGNCGQEQEKTGSLVYLDGNRKTELARIHFEHLGIFKISGEKQVSGSDKIPTVKVEMYCERMEMKFN